MTPGGRTKNRDPDPIFTSLHAELYQRRDDGGWTHQRLKQPDDAFSLLCLQVSVSLRDIYADIPELMG